MSDTSDDMEIGAARYEAYLEQEFIEAFNKTREGKGEHMSDFVDSLLADLPSEEVVDKRIGKYDDAVFKTEVEIQANEWEGKNIYSLLAKFDITDQEGNPAVVQQGIGIPDAEAPGWAKQALLQWLRAFELIPATSKNAPILPAGGDEDVRREFVEKVAAAFNSRVGAAVPIVVYNSKKGFVNVRAGNPLKKG